MGNYNIEFFNNEGPEVLYWLGFLAADGCVKNRKYGNKQMSLVLSNKDKNHLKKFIKAIDFTGKLYYDKVRNSVGVTITLNKKIENILRTYNIVPRKSLIYTFPEKLITNDLVNHFMRGYFDGDGSFYIVGQKGKRNKKLCSNLRGTIEFLEVYNKIVIKSAGISNNRKICLYDGIGSLSFIGNKISVKIRDFLYKNSTNDIRLERKYKISNNKYFNKMPENCNFKKVRAISKETQCSIEFKSIKEAAQYLSLKANSISRCLVGKRKTYSNFYWEHI